MGTISLIDVENMYQQRTDNYHLRFMRLAEMVWDVLLFWARLHFPFIFGMECSTDDWCFPLSLGHLFIGVEYEEKSNILGNTQTLIEYLNKQIGYMMLTLDNCLKLAINFQFWPWENGFRSPDSTNHQGKL